MSSPSETPTPTEAPAQSPTPSETPAESPASAESEPKSEPEEEKKDEPEEDDGHVVVPVPVPSGASKESKFVASQGQGVDDIESDLNLIKQWHPIFIGYMSAKRAPLLLKLYEIHTTSNDGLNGLKQTNALLDQLIDKYQRLQESTVKTTTVYGKPLKDSPANLPVITASGQGDASILSLAALISHFYESNVDYLNVVEKLRELRQTLQPFHKEPTFKNSYNAIKVGQTKQIDADKQLGLLEKAVNHYKINKSNIEYLGSKKRTNITIARDTYIRSVAALWKSNAELHKLINANIEEVTQPELERQAAVQKVLMEVSQLMLQLNTQNNTRLQATIAKQQYAPTQATNYNNYIQSQSHRPTLVEASKNTTVEQSQPDKTAVHFIKVNPSLPSPVPSVLTKSSTKKLFVDIPEDATMMVLEQNIKNATVPAKFPADTTILKSTKDAKNYGTFTDKPAELVYTKTHQIQMYLTKDAEKTKSEVPHGEGAPSLELRPEPEWTLDGSIVIATADPKKKNIVTLLEHSKGFFSISHKATVVFPSEGEASEWIQFVNENNAIPE